MDRFEGCEREEYGVRIRMVKHSKMRGNDNNCQADGCVVELVAMLDKEMEISRNFYACFKYAGREGGKCRTVAGRQVDMRREGKNVWCASQLNI